MKKEKRPIEPYYAALLLLGGGAVALRTAACFTSWNNLTKHFNQNLLTPIGDALVILSLILFATYFLIAKKEDRYFATSYNTLTYIPAGLVTVALLFLSVQRLSVPGSAYAEENAVIGPLAIILSILGICALVSFFLTVFIQKNENGYKAMFCLSVVAFLALCTIFLYFNRQTHPTNSPAKVVDIIAYVSAAIFFLYETRINLGRALWRPYAVFGLAASLLTAYSSIPTLIYYAVSGVCISQHLYESVLMLTLCIFITARILMLRSLSHEDACETAQCIQTLFRMREEEISRAHASADVTDNMEESEAEDYENYTMDLTMPEAASEPIGSEEND